MEKTLTVDAQKLQILSDRIAQTIDALNHVRFSAMNQNPMTGVWGQNFNQVPFQGMYGFGLSTHQIPSYDYRLGFNGIDARYATPSYDYRMTGPQYGFGYGYMPSMNPAYTANYFTTPFSGVFGTPAMTPTISAHGMNPASFVAPWAGQQTVPFYGQTLSPMAHSWGQYNLYNAPVYGEALNRTRINEPFNNSALGQTYASNPMV